MIVIVGFLMHTGGNVADIPVWRLDLPFLCRFYAGECHIPRFHIIPVLFF